MMLNLFRLEKNLSKLLMKKLFNSYFLALLDLKIH